jgi:hypothetical protein
MSSEIGKRVYRTTRGVPIAGFRRIESKADAEEAEPEEVADATGEVTDQVDPPDMPAVYGDSPRAKERWARLVAYFKSPIKAKAASTPGERHSSALRDHASGAPVDYDSLLAKVRNRRGDK